MLRSIPISEPQVGRGEYRAVRRVLKSGLLAQGPEVEKFETEFAETAVNGVPSLAVSSGTMALHLGLLAAGIGPGDEVIVPSFTFAATGNVVAAVGAKPVFVDVDPSTFNLVPELLAGLVSNRTAAVIVVHLYGCPAPLDEIAQFCGARGLLLIEDAAQAHLAACKDLTVGTISDLAAFSFYPSKNMTTGEGGMITTSSPDLLSRAKTLRNQGQTGLYESELVGLNGRMTDIQAAIGRVQLSKLARRTEARILHANDYFNAFHALTTLATPRIPDGAKHVFNQYTLKVPAHLRDLLKGDLASQGIDSRVYYPVGLHQMKQFGSQERLPVTESLSREVLSIPVFPGLTRKQRMRVIDTILSFDEKYSVATIA